MPMPAPMNQGWVYDFVNHYRLDEAIIRQYLKEQFHDYDFRVEDVGDYYRVYVPQKLTDLCAWAMEELEAQCNDAECYPRNLPTRDHFPHMIDLKHRFLDEEEGRLFSSEERARIDFLEYGVGGIAFWDRHVTSVSGLRKYFRIGKTDKLRDPWCRYLFLSAQTSRDPLHCTREMLMLSFTYLQVPPDFVDFLSLFGRQSRPKHFHFSAFRQRTRLCSVKTSGQKSPRAFKIEDCGRSGRDLSVCYNLKSVESSPQTWRWSIRDCAVSHSFDVEFSRTTWLILKGNNLMRDRIRSAAKGRSPPGLASFQDMGQAFAATLLNHLLICGWAVEGWSSYIYFLEEKYHEVWKKAVSNDLQLPLAVTHQGGDNFPRIKRTESALSTKTIKTVLSHARTRTLGALNRIKEKPVAPGSNCDPDLEASQDQPLFLPGTQQVAVEFETLGQEAFSLHDLQHLQYLQDKTSEAGLVLKLNLTVMSQMRQYYQTTTAARDFPSIIAESCTKDLNMFDSLVKGHESDIQMYIMKLETLVGSMGELKTLLNGVLDWQNTKTNKYLASQSSVSAMNMERMGREMNDLASKTKSETVSMRVITLVTLAFLPGTYISGQ